MGLLGIAHASVVVSDVERSLRFYRDLLGLVVTSDERIGGAFVSTVTGMPGTDVRVVLLSAGDPAARVELVQFHAPVGCGSRPSDMPAVGASHLALRTDDLHGLYATLVAAGVRTVSPPACDGSAWALQLWDPDGIRVELMQTA